MSMRVAMRKSKEDRKRLEVDSVKDLVSEMGDVTRGADAENVEVKKKASGRRSKKNVGKRKSSRNKPTIPAISTTEPIKKKRKAVATRTSPRNKPSKKKKVTKKAPAAKKRKSVATRTSPRNNLSKKKKLTKKAPVSKKRKAAAGIKSSKKKKLTKKEKKRLEEVEKEKVEKERLKIKKMEEENKKMEEKLEAMEAELSNGNNDGGSSDSEDSSDSDLSDNVKEDVKEQVKDVVTDTVTNNVTSNIIPDKELKKGVANMEQVPNTSIPYMTTQNQNYSTSKPITNSNSFFSSAPIAPVPNRSSSSTPVGTPIYNMESHTIISNPETIHQPFGPLSTDLEQRMEVTFDTLTILQQKQKRLERRRRDEARPKMTSAALKSYEASILKEKESQGFLHLLGDEISFSQGHLEIDGNNPNDCWFRDASGSRIQEIETQIPVLADKYTKQFPDHPLSWWGVHDKDYFDPMRDAHTSIALHNMKEMKNKDTCVNSYGSTSDKESYNDQRNSKNWRKNDPFNSSNSRGYKTSEKNDENNRQYTQGRQDNISNQSRYNHFGDTSHNTVVGHSVNMTDTSRNTVASHSVNITDISRNAVVSHLVNMSKNQPKINISTDRERKVYPDSHRHSISGSRNTYHQSRKDAGYSRHDNYRSQPTGKYRKHEDHRRERSRSRDRKDQRRERSRSRSRDRKDQRRERSRSRSRDRKDHRRERSRSRSRDRKDHRRERSRSRSRDRKKSHRSSKHNSRYSSNNHDRDRSSNRYRHKRRYS